MWEHNNIELMLLKTKEVKYLKIESSTSYLLYLKIFFYYKNKIVNLQEIYELFKIQLSYEESILDKFCCGKGIILKTVNVNLFLKFKELNDKYIKYYKKYDSRKFSVLFLLILLYYSLKIDKLICKFTDAEILSLIIFLLYDDILIKQTVCEIFDFLIHHGMKNSKTDTLKKTLNLLLNLDKNYFKTYHCNSKKYNYKHSHINVLLPSLMTYEKPMSFNIEHYYIKVLLPVLITYETPINFDIIKKICQIYKNLIKSTLEYFDVSFTILKNEIQSNILAFINQIKEYPIDYKDHIIYIIINASKSTSASVINNLYLLFSNIIFLKFIKAYISDILPNIFTYIYKNSKIFWNLNEKIELLKILDVFLKFDHKLFQECLINHNKKKYFNQINN